MMYEVVPATEIDYGATGVKEVLQNVACILATTAYEQPMFREAFWQPDIDMNINVARMRAIPMIIDTIEKYEPRAHVAAVDFIANEQELDGILTPKVKVTVDETTL